MLAFLTPGPFEMGIILVVALLIFGKRLPSVMKNLGKGIVEFKRGVQGIEDQVDNAVESGNGKNTNNYQSVESSKENDSGTKEAEETKKED